MTRPANFSKVRYHRARGEARRDDLRDWWLDDETPLLDPCRQERDPWDPATWTREEQIADAFERMEDHLDWLDMIESDAQSWEGCPCCEEYDDSEWWAQQDPKVNKAEAFREMAKDDLHWQTRYEDEREATTQNEIASWEDAQEDERQQQETPEEAEDRHHWERTAA